MKIVKYIFLLIFLAAIAGAVFIATQNGKYDVTEQRVINVPRNVLYNYINDYKNWENAGILTGSDTTAVFTFTGNAFGEGASASWKLADSEGDVKTIKLVENDSIIQKAVIDREDSDVIWAFKDTLNATKVTLTMTGNLTFMEKASSLLNGQIEDKLGATLKKGLANINTFLVDELTTFNVKVQDEIISKTGAFYIGQSLSCKPADVSKKMTEIMPKLLSFVKSNKMQTHGSPFTIYKGIDTISKNALIKICVPIKEEIFTSPGSEFEGGKLEPFNALKTTLTGDYSHLQKAWDAANKHIADKQLQRKATLQSIEVYTKNTQQTKRPSQWVTNIYIPVVLPAPIVDPTLQDPNLAGTGTVQSTTTPAHPTAIQNKPAATVAPPKVTGTTIKPANGTTIKPITTKPTTGTTKPATTTPAKPKPVVPKNTKPKDTLTYKK